MSKVYDCFAFFNEMDLLEIRLNELYDTVDHFVLVEATRTFQKTPKPLYYYDNRERFKKFSDKIIHVVVDKYPHFFSKFRVPHAWDYDNSQKEFILQGLKDAAPDDMIIVSDVDEIPLKSFVEKHRNSSKISVFEQYLCFYYLNNICTLRSDGDPSLNRDGYGYWRGPVMLRKKQIKTIKSTRMLRDHATGRDVQVLANSGWHFSFLGGTDQIIKKIEAWTHAEFNNEKYKNREYIEASVREGKSIFDPNTRFKLADVRDTALEFPVAVRTRPEAYSHLILKP